MAATVTAVSLTEDANNRFQINDSALAEALTVTSQGGWDWWYRDQNNDYGTSSWKTELVGAIKITDGSTVSYKLLEKQTNAYTDMSGATVTNVNWNIHVVDAKGQAGNSNWTRAVSEFELPLNLDLNGDGQKGVIKTEVADTGSVKLFKDGDGTLYIREGSEDKTVLNNWGDNSPASLLWSNSYSGGGDTSSVAAFVAKTDSNNATYYLMAIKQQGYSVDAAGNRSNTYSSWQIINVGADGKITRQDWSQSISLYEGSDYFNKDLNGDNLKGLENGAAVKIIGYGANNLGSTTTETAVNISTVGVFAGRDADGAIYVVRKADANTPVTYKAIGWYDSGMQTVRPDSIENAWGMGTEMGKNQVVAIKEVLEGGTLSHYLLAIKETRTSGTTTTVNWNIRKLRADTSEQNYIETDWSGSVYTKSAGTWEVEFNKDLNGDGVVGINARLTTVDTDTAGAAKLAKDTDGALYIVDTTGNTENKLLITDQWGNTPNLENNYGGAAMPGYGSGSTKAIAVERVNESGSHGYKLAVKSTSTYDGKTEVNWTIYNLDKDGRLDWSSTYTKSIAKFEETFQQDLNEDGAIGINIAKLEAVTTDTTGAQLVKDTEGALYIKNGSSVFSITDSWGSNPSFEYSSSWTGGSNESKAVAVERQADGSYLLAIRNTNVWTDMAGQKTTDINWQIHTLTSDGGNTLVMDWMNSKYTKSITAYEKSFNQDLNGDGYTGIDPASLITVTTDTIGVGLAKDTEGGIYLKDGTSFTAITDTNGNTPYLEYSSSWTSWDGKTVNSNKSEVVAAEKQDDGTYRLAVKNSNSYEGKTDTSWQIYTLNTEGKLDWGSPAGMASGAGAMTSSWSRSITKFEPLFKQDLNGDGYIGIDAASLTAVTTDTTGATLLRGGSQAENNSEIYIKDGSNIISISDPYGGSPQLEYSNSWTEGSNKSEAIAVEKQADGSFKLAVKHTNVYSGTTETNWQVYTLSGKGVIDWSQGSWSKTITSSETFFNQDLNGDGFIGVDPSKLTAIRTDRTGATLVKDAEGNLYVKDGNVITAVTDTWGGTPSLEYSNSWGDGSSKSEAVAVEKQSDGSYKLAVKQTSTWSGNTTVNWQVYTLNAKMQLDWSKSSYAKGIASFETLFNQDLSGDGVIGIDPATLLAISSDKTGATLAQDSDAGLYIIDGTSVIAITDSYGGVPQLTYSNSWSGGSSSSDALAVEKQTDGTYKLVIRNSYTYSDTKDISYQVYTLSDKGVLDWSKSSWSKSIAAAEPLFKQDLNNDGRIGIDPESIKLIATDDQGEKLARDAERALYVVNADSTILAITDTNGGVPTFEWDNSWDNGSYKSEGYAVQKQADGTFKLAIKNTNTYNGETNVDWQIHTLNASAALDWSNSTWTRSVASHEKFFAQDLNGDGTIGLDTSKLITVSTDTTGATLVKDAEGALFIKDGEELIAITDTYGGTPYLEWSSKWEGGSSKSEAVAVEKQSDNSFRLAVRNENTYNSKTEKSWQIHTLDAEGKLDWSKSSYTRSVTAVEKLFNQDLDGDGVAGADLAKLTQVATDTTGVSLHKDGNFALYIKDGQDFISIVDANGGAPALEYSDSWTGGKVERKAFAVEKQTDGSFVLAIKVVTTAGSSSKTSWEVMNVGAAADGKAVIDWSSLSKVKRVSRTEDLIKEDMNGDGVVGSGAKTKLTTDTNGVQLARDTGGSLYILEGQKEIALVNAAGQAANLEPAKLEGDWGSITTQAMAAQDIMKANGQGTAVLDHYLVAVKVTTVIGSGDTAETSVNWKIYTVNLKGEVNPVATDTPSITSYETEAFFNEAGLDSNTAFKGLDTATLETREGDDGTHTLAVDPDGALYIQTSGQTTPLRIASDQPLELAGNDSVLSIQAVAVEGVSKADSEGNSVLDHYLVATKTSMPITGGQTLDSWDLVKVGLDGKVDWSSSSQDVDITKYERTFNQDLNDDGTIGETVLNTLSQQTGAAQAAGAAFIA
jgi:mannose/fructose-specific phosphotransferase system component IIA